MTRKRFVKLLMGRFGYCRDWANDIAFTVRRHGGTYADEFFWFCEKLNPIGADLSQGNDFCAFTFWKGEAK